MVISPGVFNIPNVPAGYYWLLLTPVPIVPPIGVWTSSSTFDSGRNEAGSPPPFTANSQTTTSNFSLAGLDPALISISRDRNGRRYSRMRARRLPPLLRVPGIERSCILASACVPRS